MKDKIIEIIKDYREEYCRDYEKNKNTPFCSYYMGGADALGELLEKIENLINVESQKNIFSKFKTTTDFNSCLELEYFIELNNKKIKLTEAEWLLVCAINDIMDYANKKERE